MELSDQQLCAARAYLKLSRQDVCEATGIGVQTLGDIETGATENPRSSTLSALRRYYELSGIEFTADGGIRPRGVLVRRLEGAEGFRQFMDDVYEVVRDQGGEICLHNAKPDNWLKWLGDDWNKRHTERMCAIERDFDFKITAGHNDYTLIGKHAEYRWLPEDMWNQQSIYAYGDRIALLSFAADRVVIVVIHNREFADGFRALFNVTWETKAQKITDRPDGSDGGN